MNKNTVADEGRGAHLVRDRARVLLEINNAVVKHLDLGQVLKSVSDCLRREMKHDYAALALYDADKAPLLIVPSLAHHPKQPNRQSARHGDLRRLASTPHH